jgi:beta-glucosidase
MPGFTIETQLGVATAATQIEGGDADTNWHRWSAIPGHVKDGSTPARAADHWNRSGADAALLADLGIRHYRMGLEWARIEPSPGRFDAAALHHYRTELTGLRQAGITPLVTLWHFNNPGWFDDAGGWLGSDATGRFVRYVHRVVTEFRDLVTDWVTVNEPNVYAVQGHLFGVWPPGRRSLNETIAVMSSLAGAHIAAYGAIKQIQPSATVCVANHLRDFTPASPLNPIHRLSARVIDHLFQGALTEAMSTGRFPWPLRTPRGVTPGTYADVQGINYYTRDRITGPKPSSEDASGQGVPVNDLGWEIHAQGLVTLGRRLHERYGVPLWVTENGTADAADAFRSRFIHDHLAAMAASGLPFERYYHWCFTDNWEWIEGEGPRFGLVELDYETQTRTPRPSAAFYADVIANGGVTEAAYERWVALSAYRTATA